MGKNATYLSWQIQNEIIECCNKIILKSLVNSVKKSKFFSIIVDETTDISNVEQMSICLRYISTDLKLQECFLQFVPMQATTSESIYNSILSFLKDNELDINLLRGQGYDGAASMAGKFNGVQAKIRQLNPKALYVHCELPDIRNCMAIVEKLYAFFNTPKRENVLKEQISAIPNESRKEKLKKLCPTRWVERHLSILTLVELFIPMYKSLEVIEQWCDNDSSSKSTLLKNTVSTPNFMLSLLVLESVFSVTLPLCKMLQKPTIDLSESM